MTERSHRAPLISLCAVFIIPAVMGWFLYHYHTYFSFKTQNHGTLINPPLSHPELLTGDASQRKWQMIYVSAECNNHAAKRILFTLHQVQKSLGKDSDRVSLTWMSPIACSSTQFPGVRQLSLSATLQNHTIYLVDPIGNVFMYYSDATDPMNILKDLKHVLGVSQIG